MVKNNDDDEQEVSAAAVNVVPLFRNIAAKKLDHGLETLERRYLNHVARRLGFEYHFFTGEGIGAFARLGRGLAHHPDLQQARHGEDTGTLPAEIALDHRSEFIKHSRHLLASQLARVGQSGKDLRFRTRLSCRLLRRLLLCRFRHPSFLSVNRWPSTAFASGM